MPLPEIFNSITPLNTDSSIIHCHKIPILVSLSLLTMLAGGISPVLAQTDAAPAESETRTARELPSTLEEVIVTARRIEESASTVPLSIRVINAAELARLGIIQIEDVVRLTPGLTYDLGGFPNDTRPAVRGMQSERGRPSTAVMLDGLDLSGENIGIAGGTAGVVADLANLERVEIVKGPQTTLYGTQRFCRGNQLHNEKACGYVLKVI